MRRARVRAALALGLLAAASAAAARSGWRVVDDHGVFWLAGPDGKRMLSRGVDCVGPGPDGAEFGTVKPTYAPAMRGNEAYEPWRRRTLDRLKGWGFNTAAGWSDANFGKMGMPFTPVLHIGIQLGMPWWDPWELDLPPKARATAVNFVAATKGHPNRIGYFLDNEFGWSDDWVFGLALGWPAKQPGKRKLVEVMRRTYHDDFRAFLADFECSATGWDGLLSATATGFRAGRGYRAMDAWLEAVIHQYDAVIAGAVREADPGALILGDRYQQYYPQAVARAARGVLDAVSTNYEATTDGWISPGYFISLHELSGLPVIVGEYYATARQNRSGNRHDAAVFTTVDTQDQRAAVAAAQARAFASFPFVVGFHWFQWMDEPTYGRDDGENYNMGLVDIRDVPYGEITSALAAVNAEADRLHAAGPANLAAWRGDGFTGPLAVARQDGLTVDGRIGEWDKSSPVPRSLLLCEAPVRPFADVFLAWDPSSLRVAVRASNFSVPTRNTPDPRDPATWGDLDRLTVVADGVTVYAATGYVAKPGTAEDTWKSVVYATPPADGVSSAAIAATVQRQRHVWEVAIPASALGGGPFGPGRRVTLSLNLQNRGDFERMHADRLTLVLRGDGPVALPGGAPARGPR